MSPVFSWEKRVARHTAGHLQARHVATAQGRGCGTEVEYFDARCDRKTASGCERNESQGLLGQRLRLRLRVHSPHEAMI